MKFFFFKWDSTLETSKAYCTVGTGATQWQAITQWCSQSGHAYVLEEGICYFCLCSINHPSIFLSFSFFVAHSTACGILVPWPVTPAMEVVKWFLTTGLPGSPILFISVTASWFSLGEPFSVSPVPQFRRGWSPSSSMVHIWPRSGQSVYLFFLVTVIGSDINPWLWSTNESHPSDFACVTEEEASFYLMDITWWGTI